MKRWRVVLFYFWFKRLYSAHFVGVLLKVNWAWLFTVHYLISEQGIFYLNRVRNFFFCVHGICWKYRTFCGKIIRCEGRLKSHDVLNMVIWELEVKLIQICYENCFFDFHCNYSNFCTYCGYGSTRGWRLKEHEVQHMMIALHSWSYVEEEVTICILFF